MKNWHAACQSGWCGKVGEKESSICTMKQKEATVCGRVSAAPIVATPVSPVGVKVLATTEKALSVGLEETSQEHILADDKFYLHL